MNKIVIAISCVWLAACASPAPKPAIVSEEVSLPSFTAAYNAFSCDQLYSEARRITDQMHDIAGVRDEDTQMERLEFVGGVLYWPVLFLVDSGSDSKAAKEEYEQLKGRLLSLSDWVIKRQCNQ